MAPFLVDSPYIDSCLEILSTTATCLQRSLSSVPKATIVERLNCTTYFSLMNICREKDEKKNCKYTAEANQFVLGPYFTRTF